MTGHILNGNTLAKELRNKIASDVVARSEHGHRVPGLAVILVGNNHASHTYVKHKKSACQHVGFLAIDHLLPETITKIELLALIAQLNEDPKIDGILVQLPLPKHIPTAEIFEAISPNRDVDGFHPYNQGLLAQGRPYLRPCTPAGIMHMLEHTKEPLSGKTATIVGTSTIVGRPMLLELIMAGVTITACNSRTIDLATAVRNADIVIAAVGSAELIKGEWIKPGAIVIDVGINRDKHGKLIGDVEFAAARERASWISPVPGGVGPMTIAALLQNTLLANINAPDNK